MVKQPSFNAIRVAVSIVHPLAILCSAVRVTYRWRLRRFWWDDTLAGFSMLFDVVFFVAIWIRTFSYRQSTHTKVATYWIVSCGFTFVLWSARLSMLLSIIRVIPPPFALRRLAFGAVALFTCIWIALITQKTYKCGKVDTQWMSVVPWAQCRLGKPIAITELVTDFVGDAILVFLPVQLLWHTHMLPPNHRTLLLVIFMGSMVTTIVSIPHAVFVMGQEGEIEGLTAHIEAGISLIVANLLVLTTLLYRLVPACSRRGGGSGTDSDITVPDFSIRRAPASSQWITRGSDCPDSFDLKFVPSTSGMDARDYKRFGEILEEPEDDKGEGGSGRA